MEVLFPMTEIVVRGLDEVTESLQNLNGAIIKSVKKSMNNRIVPRCVGKAKLNCTPGESPYEDMNFPTKIAECERKGIPYSGAPFKIGDLRRSIGGKADVEGNSVRGVIGTNSDYAFYVHEGTSYMWARPFLKDAVVECMQQTVDDVKIAIDEAIQDVGLQSSGGMLFAGGLGQSSGDTPTMPEEE